VRKNIPGKGLVSLNYGLYSSLAVDPIEKKPLYHWHPGSKILSLGSVGCNMVCPFCQNWQIATWAENVELTRLDPHEIVKLTKDHGLDSVAFTYNEPLVGFESFLESSRDLKKEGLKVVLVSNGLICGDPLLEITPYIDAANIDLKSFTEEGYRKLGGDLNTVKSTITTMYEKGIHIELTHLVVPGINDDPKSFLSMVRWIGDLSPDMVLHLSRYFPNYHWQEQATSLTFMRTFEEIARDYLNFVYLGNVPGESITRCKECGKEIIVRNGYTVTLFRTDRNGRCSYCGSDNNIEI
jgi:pyruvate formate lyase activating enzyme